jgi:predicted Zn-dependent protease
VKNRTFFLMLPLFGIALAGTLLAGCGLLPSKAERAYSQYQAALAGGDKNRVRAALVALASADEDNPDYWIELGKIQIEFGDYAKAYDAFSRAYEVDRSNVPVLTALTQMALLSGNIPLADEQAKTLALLSPDNPTVTLVRGYVALQAGDLGQADGEASKLLAGAPTDPDAKILKARVLIARSAIPDAVSLLEAQHKAEPEDRMALRALSALYRNRSDWRNATRADAALHKLDPDDTNVAQDLIEASLRSGNLALARVTSVPLLSASSNPGSVQGTLDLWARFSPALLPGVVELANASAGDNRVAFANYFNRMDRPAVASHLLGGRARLPVTSANLRWDAVIAQSLSLQKQEKAAKQLFNLILAKEPDQLDALRGRSALAARTGSSKQAIVDAQRLVSASPNSGEDRLLLAQAYLAGGHLTDVKRTLWEAFQAVPDDERVLAALKRVLGSTGDADAEQRLNDEYADKELAKLRKELV